MEGFERGVAAVTSCVKTQRDSSTAWRRVPRSGTPGKGGRHFAQNDAVRHGASTGGLTPRLPCRETDDEDI
jgi:hypothetical protein